MPLQAPPCCEEDRPLSAAEAAQARSALAALPAELRARAFGGGGGDVELRDLVARCVRGEHPAPRAFAVLRDTLLWRRDVGADAVRAAAAARGAAARRARCAADETRRRRSCCSGRSRAPTPSPPPGQAACTGRTPQATSSGWSASRPWTLQRSPR